MGRKRKPARPKVDPRTLYSTTSIPKPKIPRPEPTAEPGLGPGPEPEPDLAPDLAPGVAVAAEKAAVASPEPSTAEPAPEAEEVHAAGAEAAPVDGPPPVSVAPDAIGYRPRPLVPTGPPFGDTRAVQLCTENEEYVLGSIGGAAQLPFYIQPRRCGVGEPGGSAVGGRLTNWNRRRLQTIYVALRDYGFECTEVERVMWLLVEHSGESEAVGLAACLDWLCLHLPNEQLPDGLKEHKIRDGRGLKVGEVLSTAAAADCGNTNEPTDDTATAEQAARAAHAQQQERRAALQNHQAAAAAKQAAEQSKSSAWMQAYALQELEDELTDGYYDDGDEYGAPAALPPAPEERLSSLRQVISELKVCSTRAKAEGRFEQQKNLGTYTGALAGEIKWLEQSMRGAKSRRHLLMPGWNDPCDRLHDAQKALKRVQRVWAEEDAEKAAAADEDGDGGGFGMFEDDEDEHDDEDADPEGNGAAGSETTALGQRDVHQVDQEEEEEEEEEEEDGLFGMFDEHDAAAAAAAADATDTGPACGQATRARVLATPAELGRGGGWTGSTPKVALQQWAQKKHRAQVKYKHSCGVCSASLHIKGSRVTFEQPPTLLYEHTQDSANAAAMVALHSLTADENLPLYRAFPPYWKDLWLAWEAEQQQEEQEETAKTDAEMNGFLERLVGRAAATTQASATTARASASAASGGLTWEHWADVESGGRRGSKATAHGRNGENGTANGRSTRGDSHRIGADAKVDAAESGRLLGYYKRQLRSEGYKRHLEQRQSLPMWGARKQVTDAVESASATLVVGETGSGKSTQVPQFILDEYLQSNRGAECNIIVTQPRRIAAVSLAQRIAAERGEPRLDGGGRRGGGRGGGGGGLVGYHIRMEAKAGPATRLMLCTTGILLRRIQGDPLLTGVSHVVIDEVHERDINIDFLLLIVRELLRVRSHRSTSGMPPLRLVVMSASFNVDLMLGYLGGAGCCPLVQVGGRAFPVEEHYLEDIFEMTGSFLDEDSRYAKRQNYNRKTAQLKISSAGGNTNIVNVDWDDRDKGGGGGGFDDDDENGERLYAEYSPGTRRSMSLVDEERINYELIVDLITLIAEDESEPGAVLVFLPGLREIQTLVEELNRSPIMGDVDRCCVLPLHSSLSPQDQQRVFERRPRGCRKIVVATNIAETSITIDDVVFVVDAGKAKINKYDPARRMASLVECWVSQASAKQRAGRAGRVRPGQCFRLFSSRRHRGMDPFETPEMLRTPLEGLVLQIKTLQLPGTVSEVFERAVQAPSAQAVAAAQATLVEIGALDEEEALTGLGYHLAALPVDVRLGKMLLYAALFSCLDPVAIVAATISYKSPFVAPLEQRELADAARRAFAVDASDHLTTVNAFSSWRRIRHEHGRNFEQQWCRKHFLSLETLETIEDLATQFARQLYEIGFIAQAPVRAGGAATRICAAANRNAENRRIVVAVLTAGLFPNVARVYRAAGTGKLTFSSNGGNRAVGHHQEVFIHPRSVNHGSNGLAANWLVYHEKVKSTHVYLRDSTLVTPYPLLLFGGPVTVNHSARRATVEGLGSGASAEFVIAPRTAVVFKELRRRIDAMLTALVGSRSGLASMADRASASEEGGSVAALLELIEHLLCTEFPA